MIQPYSNELKGLNTIIIKECFLIVDTKTSINQKVIILQGWLIPFWILNFVVVKMRCVTSGAICA